MSISGKLTAIADQIRAHYGISDSMSIADMTNAMRNACRPLISRTVASTSITIPSGATCIGRYAFAYFTGLTSVTIPSSVISIGYNAFVGCINLTSVTIPSSVISIEFGAFQGCTSLTSVTIPSSVTSIGVAAFHSCTGLTSITIPASVTSIGQNAFTNSTLTDIYCGFAEGAVSGAPWGAANATIHYNATT